MEMLPQSTVRPCNGSFTALESKNARNRCVLGCPVDAMHRCYDKFFLRNNGGYNQRSVSFRRVGYNLKSCPSKVQNEGQLKLESSKMQGHIQKVEDIDLKAKASDFMGSKPGAYRRMYAAADRHHGSSSYIIQNSIYQDDGIEMGKHYEKMIGDDPRNPMLLRNYGHYLYEFKRNLRAAENCYLPALLLDPENSQYMVEYAQIAWELRHSEWITKYFFKRAIKASPDDSFVHAAYARFLYQIEDDDDED